MWQKYSVRFLRLGLNHTMTSSLLSLRSLAQGEDSCCVVKMLKKPHRKDHIVRDQGHLPVASEELRPRALQVCHLGCDLSNPSQASGDCSPGCHFDCNFIKDPEPDPLVVTLRKRQKCVSLYVAKLWRHQ